MLILSSLLWLTSAILILVTLRILLMELMVNMDENTPRRGVNAVMIGIVAVICVGVAEKLDGHRGADQSDRCSEEREEPSQSESKK